VDLRWWSGGQWTEHLMPWSAVAPAFWAQSVHAAGNAEERLSAWAARAICLFVASSVLIVVVMLASSPAEVYYLRQIFDHVGTSVPRQPAALQLTNLAEFPIEILVGLVFLMWQYRAAATARILGYPARRSPGLGVGTWFIPVVNFWFPYQALRDLLPPGHATRSLVLRTWLCYVFTVPAVLASELTALAWLDVGVAIGIVAILGWILVGAYGYRVVKAVSMDHGEAAHRV
jgi:hypothetical protein